MRSIVLLLIIFYSFQNKLFAQEDLNGKYQKAYALVRENKTSESIRLLQEVMRVNSYFENVYAVFAFNYLMQGDLIQAETYLKQIEDMGETSIYPIFMMANLKVFQGNINAAKELIKRALQYKSMDSDIQDMHDTWDAFIKFNKQTAAFKELKSWLSNVNVNNASFTKALQNYEKALAQAKEGKDQDVLKAFANTANALNSLSPKAINTVYKWQAELGATLFYNGYIEPGGQLLENTYYNTIGNEKIGNYVKTIAAYYYVDYLKYVGKLSQGTQVVDRVLPFSQRLLGKFLYADLLVRTSEMLGAQNLEAENIKISNKLLAVAKNMGDKYFETQAYNSLGSSYMVSTDPQDRNKAKQYLEQANSLAEQNEFTYLAEAIQGNLAITYWQSGQRDKAVSTYQKLINSQLAANRQQDAIINMNNVGSMFFFTEDYARAIPYFEKTIDITEQYRQELNSQNRITYLQSQLSAYQFLTYCYARTGDGAGLFSAIDKQRGRVLTERLNLKQQTAKTTLSQFQAMLRPDEAVIFYSLTEPGAVAINVVTKERSYAVLNEFFREFVNIKQRYFDQARQLDMQRTGFKLPANARVVGERILMEKDIANLFNQEDFELMVEMTRELLQSNDPKFVQIKAQFLNHFYHFLFSPISNYIAGKKKLIISSDGLLNFIPFEALIGDDGRYLIERYGIRYMQSASIGNHIRGRHYSGNRKPMLAMGGAIYEEMSAKADPVRSVERMQEISFLAVQNVGQGLSQRNVYAALGFGKMNYLPGTLNEVNTISQIVKGAEIYTGQAMNESFLKQLSQSGKLDDYKVVHLATHGFSLPAIPELSGIAMSIFKEEQNGQDGYLIASELANLKLNADLVVLSACETGLGKIYGGEGVIGLTQSLILAGANRVVVSLWPVNDASTMYFMSGMYDLVRQTNMTYDDAIDDIKRRFIRGEFGENFRGTNFWAPFIHYGN